MNRRSSFAIAVRASALAVMSSPLLCHSHLAAQQLAVYNSTEWNVDAVEPGMMVGGPVVVGQAAACLDGGSSGACSPRRLTYGYHSAVWRRWPGDQQQPEGSGPEQLFGPPGQPVLPPPRFEVEPDPPRRNPTEDQPSANNPQSAFSPPAANPWDGLQNALEQPSLDNSPAPPRLQSNHVPSHTVALRRGRPRPATNRSHPRDAVVPATYSQSVSTEPTPAIVTPVNDQPAGSSLRPNPLRGGR